MADEEHSERLEKINGRLYQIVTIKREITQDDISKVEEDLNKLQHNIDKDKERLLNFKNVMSDV